MHTVWQKARIVRHCSEYPLFGSECCPRSTSISRYVELKL